MNRKEGDCIMGAGNRSAIGTLVERHTRFLALIHVPLDQPTAQAIRAGRVGHVLTRSSPGPP